jgi:hypothetical protein
VAIALPAVVLAALLVAPGAAFAGEVFGPDLTVTIDDTPDPVAVDETVTFTMLISNVGDDDSFETQLDFFTAESASVVDASVTGGAGDECTIEGNSASCDVGFVPSPSSTDAALTPALLLDSNQAEVIVTVTPPDAPGTSFSSDATASSVEQTDQNPADNTDTESTDVIEGSGNSASGVIAPNQQLTTVNGTRGNPVSADDPFAVSLKNVSDGSLDASIEEEDCDGTQEGDELCSEPRIGGVAGDFRFEPVQSEPAAANTVTTGLARPVTIAKLFYDRSSVRYVPDFVILYQKNADSPVLRLRRCKAGVRTTECFRTTKLESGDQIVRVPLSHDPRVTRG